MADQHLLTPMMRFPQPPPGASPDLVAWAKVAQDVMRDQYAILAHRLEELIVEGTIAERPAANGTMRFYFANDESPPVMYFDNGTWHALNAT